MIRVLPITTLVSDAQYVARFLRQEDRDELWELNHSLGHEAVRQSIEASTEAYLAYADDKPIAVFGASVPVLSDVGVPWFLGTRGVDLHANEYMRLGRKFTQHLLARCVMLENIALRRNRRSLVFLSRMGFAIGEPFITATGAEAVHFTMERKHV
tara:strand:+ start:3403 stop:3867 length:465 start_codon:yes stop_codon:yes gene_type:complete